MSISYFLRAPSVTKRKMPPVTPERCDEGNGHSGATRRRPLGLTSAAKLATTHSTLLPSRNEWRPATACSRNSPRLRVHQERAPSAAPGRKSARFRHRREELGGRGKRALQAAGFPPALDCPSRTVACAAHRALQHTRRSTCASTPHDRFCTSGPRALIPTQHLHRRPPPCDPPPHTAFPRTGQLSQGVADTRAMKGSRQAGSARMRPGLDSAAGQGGGSGPALQLEPSPAFGTAQTCDISLSPDPSKRATQGLQAQKPRRQPGEMLSPWGGTLVFSRQSARRSPPQHDYVDHT